MRMLRFIIVLAVALGLVACAANDPNRRTKVGAGVGAAAGALLGYGIGDNTAGTIIGATGGALVGGAVGHYMDKQQLEFEQALAGEQRQHDLEIERLRDDTLKLSVDSEVSFDFGKDQLKPAFYPTLNKLGDVLGKYNRTVVHVVGHTDSVGSDTYNLALSKRRAGAVGDYLASRGVPQQRLRTEGRGESEPRDTNATEAGRQLNRRVEIYVKPIVEGREQQAYEPPSYM